MWRHVSMDSVTGHNCHCLSIEWFTLHCEWSMLFLLDEDRELLLQHLVWFTSHDVVLYLYIKLWQLVMSFQDVAFLPCRASFHTDFVKVVVEVKALGQPHVLRLVGGRQEHALCRILFLHIASC